MNLKSLMIESQYESIVCRCNMVSAGELLDLVKFNGDAPTKDILKKLKIGTSCGLCLDKEKGKEKEKYHTYYKDVLK